MAMVIFTDLDASLLDHSGYGFAGALPALAQIKARRIPLIVVTSKCRPEVERVQARLGIADPFIVENGAALYLPKGYPGLALDHGQDQGGYTVVRWGLSYAKIRAALVAARRHFPVHGFGDMALSRVAELTGLSAQDVALARQREFSEPFVLDDPARLGELETWAAARNLAIARGGRFFHLIGANQDKGRAVRYLIDGFAAQSHETLVSVGIGDSPNDGPMLGAVDVPVLIPHDDGSVADLRIPGLVIGPGPGSRGWNDAVLRILNPVAL